MKAFLILAAFVVAAAYAAKHDDWTIDDVEPDFKGQTKVDRCAKKYCTADNPDTQKMLCISYHDRLEFKSMWNQCYQHCNEKFESRFFKTVVHSESVDECNCKYICPRYPFKYCDEPGGMGYQTKEDCEKICSGKYSQSGCVKPKDVD